ncbi:MAG: hypothetical protein ACXVPN_16405 [Bacteroidia bacterium]
METKKNAYNSTIENGVTLSYASPELNFTYFKNLTSDFGIRQFSSDNSNACGPGYTLEDNAIALIIQCNRFEKGRNEQDIAYIKTYFDFIQHCLQSEGYFLNYVDDKGAFTKQNDSCNLADINGKAIWALGRLISISSVLPRELVESAEAIMKQVLYKINTMFSKRAMAYSIKGLYYYNLEKKSGEVNAIIKGMANRLEQMYKRSSEKNWQWFEGYIEPGDCVLPEALLYAYAATGEPVYRDISRPAFDFMLSHTFNKNNIPLNFYPADKMPTHLHTTELSHLILALGSFYSEFQEQEYLIKMQNAFNLLTTIRPAITGADLVPSTAETINYLHAGLMLEACFNKKDNRQIFNEDNTIQPQFLPVLNSGIPVKLNT